MEPTRIVISDLHIGRHDKFDIFEDPTHPPQPPGTPKSQLFAGFIDHIRASGTPVELIINGDFVDFLQLQPWDDVSRPVALRKMQEIALHSAYVFDKFGDFLRDTEHKIIILPGNHDVELAYPEVGDVLRKAILRNVAGAEARLQIFGPDNTHITYKPRINGTVVHIEHGNFDDPWNTLAYNDLFLDAQVKSKKFSYPPGTKLVYQMMNGFKEELQFVDLLKPEIPAVPLILFALKPYLSGKKIPAFAWQLTLSVLNGVRGWVGVLAAGRQLGELRAEGALKPKNEEDRLARDIALALGGKALSPEDLQQYLGVVATEATGADGAQYLGLVPDYVKHRLAAAALRGLTFFQAAEQGKNVFEKNYPNKFDSKNAFKRLVSDEVKLVVFGHTHETLKTEFPKGKGVYVNTGTWANLIHMPQDSKKSILSWLDQLVDNSFERTSYPTYVKIEPREPSGINVSVNHWTPSGGELLWQKNI
jgi:UDP-2,3-diacylglucosamine pyrophosphatase LpxH